MLKLFKATATVSIVTIVTMATGIIRAKYTAVALGPAGIGIFAQAAAFQQLAVTIAALGIGLGTTKYIARRNQKGESDAIASVISASTWMQVFASAAVVILSFAFSAILSKMIFSDTAYSAWVGVISLGAPFLALAVTGDAILLGFGNYKAFAKVKSVLAIIALALLVVTVWLMGINGVFIYLLLLGLFTFFVYCRYIYKNIPREISLSSFGLSGFIGLKESLANNGRYLLSYGGVSFVTGALGSITLVGSRSLLVRYFGADSNGYYQVVFLLSASYLPFFTNGLWSYFYPKISALTDRDRYSVEVNHAIRLCAFGIVPLVAAVYIFRKSIIYTVFTGKFVPAETLFSAQLGGDVFFLLYYVMATSLLAGGRLKAYLVSGAVYAILFIGLFMAFKFKLGVNAITVSYLVSNALLFIASVIYHVYYMGIKIYKRNVNLLLSASAVCGIILFLGSGSIIQTVFKSVILILWLYFLPTDLERRKAASFISNKIRGIYGFSG